MTIPYMIAGFEAGQGLVLVGVALWLDRRISANHKNSLAAIEVVRVDVNGKMEQLLRVTEAFAEARGEQKGRAEEKAEEKALHRKAP
jgi:hypothetical protein